MESEPSSSRRIEHPKSRLSSKVYDGIRKAHKEGDKDSARHLRNVARERIAKINERGTSNESKYIRIFQERSEKVRKHTSETAQVRHPETTTVCDNKPEEDYARLEEAIRNLHPAHDEHCRALIAMPGRRWMDFAPPRDETPPNRPMVVRVEKKRNG